MSVSFLNSHSTRRFPFFSLPSDLQEAVFLFLAPDDIANASLVCKSWLSVIENGLIYKALISNYLGIKIPINLIFSGHFQTPEESPFHTPFEHWKQTFASLYKTKVGKVFPKKSCEHYTRNCMIRAECCGNFYNCRFCHDDDSDHPIDRFSTKVMKCNLCGTVQDPAKTCHSCDAVMGTYFCKECKLWSSNPDINVYHCDKCGLCRLGKGLGIDNFHCERCGICLSLNVRDRHICTVKGGLKTTCPGCTDRTLLFYSREPVILMHCGHGTHLRCFRGNFLNNFEECAHCEAEEREREARYPHHLQEGHDQMRDHDHDRDNDHEHGDHGHDLDHNHVHGGHRSQAAMSIDQ